MDYEEQLREYDEGFDVYDHITESLGIAESTLRNWLNISHNHFCDPSKLVNICSLINDPRPINLLSEYLSFFGNQINKPQNNHGDTPWKQTKKC